MFIASAPADHDPNINRDSKIIALKNALVPIRSSVFTYGQGRHFPWTPKLLGVSENGILYDF